MFVKFAGKAMDGIVYLLKGQTINDKLLEQLNEKILKQRVDLSKKKIIFYPDNACSHTSNEKIEWIEWRFVAISALFTWFESLWLLIKCFTGEKAIFHKKSVNN